MIRVSPNYDVVGDRGVADSGEVQTMTWRSAWRLFASHPGLSLSQAANLLVDEGCEWLSIGVVLRDGPGRRAAGPGLLLGGPMTGRHTSGEVGAHRRSGAGRDELLALATDIGGWRSTGADCGELLGGLSDGDRRLGRGGR